MIAEWILTYEQSELALAAARLALIRVILCHFLKEEYKKIYFKLGKMIKKISRWKLLLHPNFTTLLLLNPKTNMWPPAVMALLPLWLHSFSTSDENILKVPTTSGTVWEQRSPKTKVCRTRSRSGSWSLGGSTWPESWRRSTPWGNTGPWRNATTRNETVRNKESFIPVTKPDKHEGKVYNLFQSDCSSRLERRPLKTKHKKLQQLKRFYSWKKQLEV